MDTTSTPPAHRALGDHSWQNRAACLPTEANPVDPELFFPAPEEIDRITAAKALCAQCRVRRICLDAALENGDRNGIRGGLTEEEREPLHRKLHARLDYTRVNAVLAGRDIHLTDAERQAVTRAAYQAGVPASRLAWLLKISEEHAEKLYRRVRRQLRNQSLETAGTRARAGLRGRHAGVQFRVPPETFGARCSAGAHRRASSGQAVGGGNGHR